MRTEGGLHFSELRKLSTLPLEEFSRTIYEMFCLGLIKVELCNQTLQEPQTPLQAQVADPDPEVVPPRSKPPAPVLSPNQIASQYCNDAAQDYLHGKYWSAVQNCKKALEYRQD